MTDNAKAPAEVLQDQEGEIYWTRPEKIIPIWWSKRWFDVKGGRPTVQAAGGAA